MASKYSNKPVKKNDPSLNLEGGAPNRQFKMKEEQLTIPGLKVDKAYGGKKKFKNDPLTSPNVA